jgi:hypothetical protein
MMLVESPYFWQKPGTEPGINSFRESEKKGKNPVMAEKILEVTDYPISKKRIIVSLAIAKQHIAGNRYGVDFFIM